VNRRLRCLYSGPHLLFAILAIASAYFVPLSTICLMWEWNLSFWSKITPRYFASGLGWMVVPATVIDASVCADVFLVKCIRTYLDFLNCAPCCCLHRSAFLKSHSNSFAFAAAVVFCAP
jgi:hypothetical protein